MVNTKNLKKIILESDEHLLKYYSEENLESQKKRYLSLLNHFDDNEDVRIYRAPGRIEILGNHTDHQLGPVICGAIDDDVIVGVSRTDGNELYFEDMVYAGLVHKVNIDRLPFPMLALSREKTQKWKSLIDGVLGGFLDYGRPLNGVKVVFGSTIAQGSGVSSSAALSVGIAKALSEEFLLDNKFDDSTLSLICQKSEHNYFGKHCGLMDQNASLRGEMLYIDFKDPTRPSVDRITKENFDLDKVGYGIVVVNTGGSHSGLDKFYDIIGNDMKEIARGYNKEVLSELTDEEISVVFNSGSSRQDKRAMHYFNEVKRVETVHDVLKDKYDGPEKLSTLLQQVRFSGISSERDLMNLYRPDIPFEYDDEQALAHGYHLGKEFLDERGGANRLMGGGFAGTTLAFVKKEDILVYREMMEERFGYGSAKVYQIRPGACRVF